MKSQIPTVSFPHSRQPTRGPCSKVREQDYQTVVLPCIWFKEEPCQFSMSQTSQSLSCSIMEKPHTGLVEWPRILSLCFSAKNSAWQLDVRCAILILALCTCLSVLAPTFYLSRNLHLPFSFPSASSLACKSVTRGLTSNMVHFLHIFVCPKLFSISHRTGRGRRMHFGSQSKFQQNMVV